MDGESFTLGSADEADRLGMRFIHQNLGLVESMSAVENCALSHGIPTGRLWRIDWKSERERVGALLDRFGVDVDVTAPVGTLPPAHRTMIAIIRALQDWEHSARLIVLDEPTATLPRGEVDRLFATHAPGGLPRHRRAVRVAPARRGVRGRHAGHRVPRRPHGRGPAGRRPHARGAHPHHAGPLDRQLRDHARGRAEQASAVQVRDLAGIDLRSLDLSVGEGEIVGLAGLLGSGRDEVVPLLSAARRRTAGEIEVGGTLLQSERPARGPARRHRDGARRPRPQRRDHLVLGRRERRAPRAALADASRLPAGEPPHGARHCTGSTSSTCARPTPAPRSST